MTIENVITSISSLVGGAASWAGDYMSMVTGSPLLLAFVLTSFVGLGIGVIRRLIRL